MNDDDLDAALVPFMRWRNPVPPPVIIAIDHRVARLLWPDMSDDEIAAALRAQGFEIDGTHIMEGE